MTPTLAIAALIIALPSCCNALVSLYDRFFAKPGARPMALSSGTPGLWALRLFNVIGVALLGVIIAQTWISPPNTRAIWTSSLPGEISHRQVGPTFGSQLAQTLRSLPQPCIVQLTGGSSVPEVEQTIAWVLRYGNVPSGPICNIQPNELPNADEIAVKPTTEPGIVIHWNPDFVPGEKLANFLSSTGLKIRVSHQLNARAPNNLIWIDIGNGSPWN
jgi:hypothetical protein